MYMYVYPQLEPKGHHVVTWFTHLGISEKEHGVLIPHPGHPVQLFEVLVEGCVVVSPAELYLEALVPTHVGS